MDEISASVAKCRRELRITIHENMPDAPSNIYFVGISGALPNQVLHVVESGAQLPPLLAGNYTVAKYERKDDVDSISPIPKRIVDRLQLESAKGVLVKQPQQNNGRMNWILVPSGSSWEY